MSEFSGPTDGPSPPALSATGHSSTTSGQLETPFNLDFEDADDIFGSLPVASDTNKSGKQDVRSVEYDGPDEWEEEMLAMQEMEAEEDLARSTAALAQTQSQGSEAGQGRGLTQSYGKGKVRGSVQETQRPAGGEAGFGESDIFASLDDSPSVPQFSAGAGEAGPSRRTRLSSIDFNIGEDDDIFGSNHDISAAQRSTKAAELPRMVPTAVPALRDRDRQKRCLLPALRAETASGRMLYIKRRNKPMPRPLAVSVICAGHRLLGARVQ